MVSMREFGGYLWLCVRTAFRHKSIIDICSTALGILVPLTVSMLKKFGVANQEDAMNNLFWQIPIGAAAVWVFARLLVSPYWVYKEAQAKAQMNLSQLGEESDKLKSQIARQSELARKEKDERLGKIYLAYVDGVTKENKYPLQAIVDAGVLEIETDAELSELCTLWKAHGLPDPFQDFSDFQDHEKLPFLKIARARGLNVSSLREACLEILRFPRGSEPA